MIIVVQVNRFQLVIPSYPTINKPPLPSLKSLTMLTNPFFPFIPSSISGSVTFTISADAIMANINSITINLISNHLYPPFGVNFSHFLLPLLLLFINILFYINSLYFSLYFSPIFLLHFKQQKLHHIVTIFHSSFFTQYLPQFPLFSIPCVSLNLFLYSYSLYFSFSFSTHYLYLIWYLFFNGIWNIQSIDLVTDRTCSFCTGWIVARILIHSIYLFSPYLSSVCTNYLNLKSKND